MGDITEAQLLAAEARGRSMCESKARAAGVSYDRATRRVILDLVSGCTYAFPIEIVEDLQNADADALADVEIDGMGFNLHWPRLDVDLYVPGLLAGVFGTRAWMAGEFTRIAGPPVPNSKASPRRPNRARPGRLGKAAQG